MYRLVHIAGSVLMATAVAAFAVEPVFENRTPVGFSVADSTTGQDFVTGKAVSVRVDLNQAATPDYPVVGNFHALERSEQLSATDTDGLQIDIAMVDVVPFGTNADTLSAPAIHVAWIETASGVTGPGVTYPNPATPVYQVRYARSDDGGATFGTAVSVAGGISYFTLSTDGSGGAFSTLDLEIDSGGNPRITYAFVTTADRSGNGNVYLGYSEDGGENWEPPLVVNEVAPPVGKRQGRRSAFPRMAIDDRDQIFITYVRGTSAGGGTDDVMLTKVDHHASPFAPIDVGSVGTVGSSGGVRLTDDAKRHTGPDLAVGDGDALHVVYFNDDDERFEHKRLITDTTWVDVTTGGWDQNDDGAVVAAFDDESADNAALEEDAGSVFPTVVVDRNRLPDRVYAVYKHGSNAPTEGIGFNRYDDDGVLGGNASWATAQPAWSTGGTPLFADGAAAYTPELDWTITERVAAVVDDSHEDRGDLHIAFTAAYEGTAEHNVYYARYNGASWTLPEMVADDDSDSTTTEDGIANTDLFLLSPALAEHPDNDHLYLAFAGGTAEGLGVAPVGDHHPYFKVLGRDLTSEDESFPVGAYEYTLTYTPTNPQVPAAQRANLPVWVHAADPADGSGLGARNSRTDAFLAGAWERVGTSLQDTQKRFEGRVDDSSGDSREWGDEDDKVGLLVKLNVLGADSITNLQVITNSSAAARSVAVGTAPFVSLTPGAYFALGADIDIVTTNSAPTVAVTDPDGVGDEANTTYTISYDLGDTDDTLGGDLSAALYAYPSAGLQTVQDIRIFATLIADENDADLAEGSNNYVWDDPSAAQVASFLFASILKVRSGSYYIYLVADDGENPPVFAVSPGAVTLVHAPVVQSVDPITAETVDTGVRTGLQANPYDLDFSVVDYDGEAKVQLFYSALAGLTSVSVAGTYPNQSFALGNSVATTKSTAITDSASLSSSDTEYSWDVTDPIVAEGAYYVYAVATDGDSIVVGRSVDQLNVVHSPRFTFYEPARNTQRNLDSGSQPSYTIQWQKGPGDDDLDDDADIRLYFTHVDPAVTNYSGSDSTALVDDADGDAQLIVGGLKEDDDGADDMYVWDLRAATNAPESGKRAWLYGVVADDDDNVSVVLGGSLKITHSPHIFLETGVPEISQGDILRIEWDDYMVDDGSGTDDAYIRLYASRIPGRTSLASLEANVFGVGGSDDTYVINSSDGTVTGTVETIREDTTDYYAWDTLTPSFALPEGSYFLYAGIGGDPTFSDNTDGEISEGPNELVVNSKTGTSPHMLLSPNRTRASAGDVLTFDVYLQTGGETATAVTAALNLGAGLTVVNAGSPFTDLDQVFTVGSNVIENQTVGNQVRFSKTGAAEVIGSADEPVGLARFQVTVGSGANGIVNVEIDEDEAAISIDGRSVPLRRTTGMSAKSARIQRVSRGRILATVMLEGRAPPLGFGDHATLLDVHLRVPGSTADISDAIFIAANDDAPATPDTVEVQTTTSGALTLISVPAGRYVLTVKDSSHVSGRTDTLSIRNGQTLTLTPAQGFFASDVRGDPSFLLAQNGRLLKGGDASGDNEIDEDDINIIDAAWGTDDTEPRFEEADINNDLRVGVEDLAAAISNISNSTGLGAPPVYRAAAVPPLEGPGGVVVVVADAGPAWLAGDEVGLTFWVLDAQDLAAYEITLPVDPAEAELIREEASVEVEAAFAGNPLGQFTRVSRVEGQLEAVAARRGRQWTASGPVPLLRLRLRLHQDGFPASIGGTQARLLRSDYSVQQLSLDDNAAAVAAPREFALALNYPNPFNPSTTIPFRIPLVDGGLQTAPVRLDIYNTLGQLVRGLVNDDRTPGHYRVDWDGRDNRGTAAASGVYFYRLTAGDRVTSRKMLLVE